jgi:hypothetical protein
MFLYYGEWRPNKQRGSLVVVANCDRHPPCSLMAWVVIDVSAGFKQKISMSELIDIRRKTERSFM